MIINSGSSHFTTKPAEIAEEREILKKITEGIIEAAMQVHRELGPGF